MANAVFTTANYPQSEKKVTKLLPESLKKYLTPKQQLDVLIDYRKVTLKALNSGRNGWGQILSVDELRQASEYLQDLDREIDRRTKNT